MLSTSRPDWVPQAPLVWKYCEEERKRVTLLTFCPQGVRCPAGASRPHFWPNPSREVRRVLASTTVGMECRGNEVTWPKTK